MSKKIKVKKNVGSKKNLGPKMLVPKKFWVQKIFGPEKFVGPKKFVCKKIFPKNFTSKKILGPRKLWVLKMSYDFHNNVLSLQSLKVASGSILQHMGTIPGRLRSGRLTFLMSSSYKTNPTKPTLPN